MKSITYNYKNATIEKKLETLLDDNTLLFDTETSGLASNNPNPKQNKEIVELALIDRHGNTVYHSLFKPEEPISGTLAIVNNIDNEKLNTLTEKISTKTSNAQELLDSVDFVDSQHFYMRLHKVWQVDSANIDYGQFLEFIAMARKKGIRTEFQPLTDMKPYVCYADIYGCAVINYDGNIFKCTARKFSVDNAEGVLTQDSSILWNVERIQRRLMCVAPVGCRPCKIYPACQGFCSQHKLEMIGHQNDGQYCPVQKDFSIDILLNFQQQYIQGKLMWL